MQMARQMLGVSFSQRVAVRLTRLGIALPSRQVYAGAVANCTRFGILANLTFEHLILKNWQSQI